MSTHRPAPKPELPPRLKHALGVAKALFKHGDESTLASAIEVVAKHSEHGPFTPREIALMKAST